MIPWSRFADIVRSHQRFVLTAHIRPDGDALGSEMAMLGILESLGKDVLLCNAFVVPANLQFLDPHGTMKRLGFDISAEQLADREVLIVLDTTAWAQLGAMAEVIKGLHAVESRDRPPRQPGRSRRRVVQGCRGRGDRSAGGRCRRRTWGGAHAGNRYVGIRGLGHRHGLVPLCVDDGRHAAAGGPTGRGGGRARPTLPANLRERQSRPACN